ncbi:TolC family protein [Candidatus Latescibacterota bacterium]
MNIKNSYLIFAIMSFSAMSVKADVWTLDHTVKKAVEVSNQVAIESLNAEMSGLDAVSAEKGWYPSVSVSTRANIISELMEIEMPFKTIRFGDYDTYDFCLRFNQLLYDGGRLKALREASLDRAAMSSYRSEAVRLGVEYQAKTAFWRIVMTGQTLKAAQHSIIEAQNHLKDVNARYKEGMVLENDVLRARLRVSQAEMDMISRNTGLESARAAFRKLVALDHDEEVTVEWNDEYSSGTISPELEKAVELRPEFRVFDAALAVSEKSARQAQADIRPAVGFFGAFNYGKPGLDLPANEWMHYFSGGVMVNWNIWDWGTSSRNVEKAMITRKQTMKKREDFIRELTNQLTDTVAECNEAQKREILAQQAAEYAERQLEQINVSYREGIVTETDYDNAHAVYTRAILEKSVSSIVLRLHEAKIEFILGIAYNGGDNE